MKKHLFILAVAVLIIAALSLVAGFFARRYVPPNLHDFPALEHDARPERRPEVVGQIKSIVGNQITIMKLEQPERNEKLEPDERRAELKNMVAEERIAEMEARLNAFTGENIVIEIPAGVEITRRANPLINKEKMRSLASSENLPAIEDVTIPPTELAEGDYLAVWLKNEISEKNVAEFVNLMFTENDGNSQK